MRWTMRIYCEDCEGLGYHEYPDYDYDENILETGIQLKCDTCGGNGYMEDDSVAEKIASLLTTYGIDEDICKKVKCNNEERCIYDCVDCIIHFFSKSCKWNCDEVCVNDKSEWCADFVDNVKCGECKYYES